MYIKHHYDQQHRYELYQHINQYQYNHNISDIFIKYHYNQTHRYDLSSSSIESPSILALPFEG